jgi:hypothetical protein
MSTLPILNELSTVATQGAAKASLEAFVAAVKQIPGAGVAEGALTIASDAITPPGGTAGVFTVDTEASAANDNLASIVQTNFPDGSLLLIHPANTARTVTVKHNAGGSGQIALQSGGDLTLADTTHWLLLRRKSTSWEEIMRSPASPIFSVVTKMSGYTVVAADRNKVVDCSGTFTLSFDPVARLGAAWSCWVRNSGTGILTLDPNASETINGVTTLTMYRGEEYLITCTGAALLTVGRQKGRIPIEVQSIASVAAIDFTIGLTTDFSEWVLEIAELIPATDNTDLWLRISQDGGSTWKSGASDYMHQRFGTADIGSVSAAGSLADTKMVLGTSLGNTGSRMSAATLTFKSLTHATKFKPVHFQTALAPASTQNVSNVVGTGYFAGNATAINGLRILMSSGNITSGIATLYGVRV